MQFETLKKSHIKRNIIIGILVVGILATLVFSLTKAKYRVTQSIPLVNGTINYSLADINIVAIYVDGEETDTIPESGYVLNEEESYCKVNDEVDESISLTYDTSSKTLGVSPMVSNNTKCYLYFDEEKILLKDQILANNPTISIRTDFSNVLTTNTTGTIYQASDADGTTYYFTGDTSNNWVQFAGFYWRIIRINGDGRIRLIYNGIFTSPSQIGFSSFNNIYNDNMYVGFKYTSYNVHGTGIKSAILEVLDTWYNSNLISYEDQIELNAGFCNDRYPSTSSSSSSNGSGGTSTTNTYYAAYIRLYKNDTPTYICQDSNDLFTDNKATRGNKSLDNPIGLITADELIYAGGKTGGYNESYYLYTDEYYWTLSPTSVNPSGVASVFYVYTDGSVLDTRVNNGYGVRPVINLKASTTISGGNGTASNPYIVN